MVLGREPEVTEGAEGADCDRSCSRFPETLSTKYNQFLYRPPLSPTASVQLMVNIVSVSLCCSRDQKSELADPGDRGHKGEDPRATLGKSFGVAS